MESLRIGRIEYANSTPIFKALGESGRMGGFEIVKGVPTELSRLLFDGKIDISPTSSFEYLKNPDDYGFLPDLSISSIGEVKSVLLFSSRPLEELSGAKIHLSPDSASSVAVLRIILERMKGLAPLYVEEESGADAALLIGDRALRVAREGGWPFVYDLGALWLELTGNPFVFALWIARRDVFERKREAFSALYRLLVAARQRAYRSFAKYAACESSALGMGEEELISYWQTLSYDLTAWHLCGLGLFAAQAHSLGLIGKAPDLKPLKVV